MANFLQRCSVIIGPSMHKKPVLPGSGSGAPRASQPGAEKSCPPRRVSAGAARGLTLALFLSCGLGAGWSLGVGSAWADGDPIAPASEASPEPPTAPPAPPAAGQSPPADPGPALSAPLPLGTGLSPAPAGPAPMLVPPETAGREDKFRDLERRAFELKDQVFRSKARLTLLSETLVSANVGTTRAVIVHQNQMGRLFQPIRVSYQIDGREIFTREDPAGVVGDGKELVVWDNGLKAGDHTVGVTVVYRGNGAKVFSYYDKYNFTARAAHRLTAAEGQTTRLLVRCFAKGSALITKVEDRPEFEFKVAGSGVPAKPVGDGKTADDKLGGKPAEAKAK